MVAAADTLPWLLMALPAGHLADRFDRGRVIVLANTLRAAAMLFAVALIVSNRISFPLLVALVLINGSGRAIYYSSLQAIVPGLIDTRDLEQANGILSGTEAGAENLAGPILGTSFFALAKALPFLIEGVTFLTSCIPFVRFHSNTPTDDGAHDGSGASNSMWEGVRLLFADRQLRVLLLLVASLSGLQGLESGVLVLLATTEWGVRQGLYGLFLAANAVGTLLGSFVADGATRRVGAADAHLRRRALGCGLPRHGLRQVVDPGRASVRTRRVRHRDRFRRGHLTAPATHAGPPDGPGRQRMARHDWGAAPVGALAAGALATAGGLTTPLVLAGVLQCAVAVVFARPLFRGVSRAAAGPEPATAAPESAPPETRRQRARAGR